MNHIISRRCSGFTFFVLLAAALVGCQSNSDPSTPLGTGPKPSAAADAKPSSAPASNLPTIRIKAGADQPLKDSKGVEWAADTGFEGGMTIDRPDLKVTGTDKPEIYRSERYSMERYSIKVPDGKYLLKLHFSEDFD